MKKVTCMAKVKLLGKGRVKADGSPSDLSSASTDQNNGVLLPPNPLPTHTHTQTPSNLS